MIIFLVTLIEFQEIAVWLVNYMDAVNSSLCVALIQNWINSLDNCKVIMKIEYKNLF